jgi:hypothetical protein
MTFPPCRLVFRGWLTLLALFAFGQAWAWNAAGHRLVAVIAWQEMGPGARQQASLLLLAHPALSSWEKQLARGKSPPATTPQALFAEA